jgi:hypothetical protein
VSKNIVLLSDGTGNSAAKSNKTNVWRLYDALDLHRDDQVAFYDDGVGSQEFLPLKILGGAVGWGLKRNVRELYKYLCRTYEDGDRIYLFGFSRGAFTVRILAGMIGICGLCKHDGTEADLERKARANYCAYRSRFRKSGWITHGVRRFAGSDTPMPARSHPDIEFIGVWDTVDAYGLPIDELAIIWDKLVYPLYFPDRNLSPTVKKACHAISVDDERLTFHPVLWDESKEANLVAEGKVQAGRIEQVWFPGVHSDVGGGYSKYPLALVALDWMISRAEADPTVPGSPGLHLIAARREAFIQHSDWHGPQHDSRSGIAAYYRYKPRDIALLSKDPDNRVQIEKPKIHRSVMERIRGHTIPYAPTGLPADYEVVSTRGTVPTFESAVAATARSNAMNAALDVVFWRRWLYAALLTATFALLLSPAFLHWDKGGICVGEACLLDPLLQWARDMLPDFAARWFYALSQNPAWLWGFVIAYAILFYLKAVTFRKTEEHAAAAWSNLKEGRSVPQWSGSLTSLFRKTSNAGLRKATKWVFAGGLLLLIVLLIAVLIDRSLFYVRSTLGTLCDGSAHSALKAPDGAPIQFTDIANPCFATGIKLNKGARYRFELLGDAAQWRDGEAHPGKGPDGFEDDSMTLWMPLRRHLDEPWLKLMGRIDDAGTESFAIGSGPTEYTARTNGEFFLYVNDAVFGLLPGRYWAWPYFWKAGRNEGSAELTITEIPGPASDLVPSGPTPGG